MDKNKALKDIYLLLVKFFGKPPNKLIGNMDKNENIKLKKFNSRKIYKNGKNRFM